MYKILHEFQYLFILLMYEIMIFAISLFYLSISKFNEISYMRIIHN